MVEIIDPPWIIEAMAKEKLKNHEIELKNRVENILKENIQKMAIRGLDDIYANDKEIERVAKIILKSCE